MRSRGMDGLAKRVTQRMRNALICLCLLVSNFAGGIVSAQTAEDSASIRAVITSQLEAFRRDDAAGAYAFAAPSIRSLFPSEDAFMNMVRQGYPAVYRSKTFRFGALGMTELGPSQIVEIEDHAGERWRALYTLEKQSDGEWRITGCYLVKAPGLST